MAKDNKNLYIFGIIAVVAILILGGSSELFSTVGLPSGAIPNANLLEGAKLTEGSNNGYFEAIGEERPTERDTSFFETTGLQTVIGGALCSTDADDSFSFVASQAQICNTNLDHEGIAFQLFELGPNGEWLGNEYKLGEVQILNGETKCFSTIIDNWYYYQEFWCDDTECDCTQEISVGCGSDYNCNDDQILRTRTCTPSGCSWEEYCGDWIEVERPGCAETATLECYSCSSDGTINTQTTAGTICSIGWTSDKSSLDCAPPSVETVTCYSCLGETLKTQTVAGTECPPGTTTSKPSCEGVECTDDYPSDADVSQLYGLKLVPPNTKVGVEFHVGARNCKDLANQKIELVYFKTGTEEAIGAISHATSFGLTHLFAVATPDQQSSIGNCVGDRTQTFEIDVPSENYDVFFGNPETPSEQGEYVLFVGTYDECYSDGGEGWTNGAVIKNVEVTSLATPKTEICNDHLDNDFDGKIDGDDEDCLGGGLVDGIPGLSRDEVDTASAVTLINSLCEFEGESLGECEEGSGCASLYALSKEGYIDEIERDSITRTIERGLTDSSILSKVNSKMTSALRTYVAIGTLGLTELGKHLFDKFEGIDESDKPRTIALCVEGKEDFELMQWIDDNLGLKGTSAYIAMGVAVVVLLAGLGMLTKKPR